MSYKASKCERRHDIIGLTLYCFLLMVNNNLWPNFAPL